MSEQEESFWVFKISVSDCAGALTSVASAFSNQEVNIDVITGTRAYVDKHGMIVVGFQSDEDTKDVLLRKMKRLTKVEKIQHEQTGPKSLAELVNV
ncbi:MAG: hypothetical protein KAS23_08990 [Anaerohalosphaera sp.]|nr:hypothetical protein [Anaerohalosphaera sp.]